MSDEFDKDIKRAFEQMSPDKDAQARMLTNILSASDPIQETTKAPQKVTKRSRWQRALPLAAALILLAGVGIFTLSQTNVFDNAANSMSEGVAGDALESRSGNSDESSTNAESADTQLYSASPAPSTESVPSEEENATSEQEDSSAESAAGVSSDATRYPLIKSDTYGTLIITNNGAPLDPSQKSSLFDGEEGAPGKAFTEDKGESIDCTIYEYPGTTQPHYVIQYPAGDNYYLAAPAPW